MKERGAGVPGKGRGGLRLGVRSRGVGAVELTVALTALVIGSALLTLSAFWAPIRRAVVSPLPEGWRYALPSSERELVAA